MALITKQYIIFICAICEQNLWSKIRYLLNSLFARNQKQGFCYEISTIQM